MELFRTAQLNLAGWSALAGACAGSGAVGGLVGRLARMPVPWRVGLCVGSGLAPLAAAVVADRAKWRRMPTSYSWGGSADEVLDVVSELRSLGVWAQLRVDPGGFEERPAGYAGDHVVALPSSVSLMYRQGDWQIVADVLSRAGLSGPMRPAGLRGMTGGAARW